jgi:hypothetical protein
MTRKSVSLCVFRYDIVFIEEELKETESKIPTIDRFKVEDEKQSEGSATNTDEKPISF